VTDPMVGQGETPARRSRFRRSAIVGVILALIAVAALGIGLVAVRPWATTPACPPIADHPDWSVARRWDEALLDAIRRALPAPTVHARNLFHTSAAMWDAWAAYDPKATGYFVKEKQSASDVEAARSEAISYAAYRVLSERYIKSVGAGESLSEFANLMDALCYPLDVTTTVGDTPAALGNRIASAVIAAGLADGSNEANGYASTDYKTVNPPLVVAKSGTTMTDPNRWQPLQIEHMISQNGIPVTNGVQQAVGPDWGHVVTFALPAGGSTGVPIDPGPPPRLGDSTTDQAFKDEAVEVIRLSSQLDPTIGATVDISPGAIGNNDLGTNDGTGHAVNPATGQPYPPDVVNQGDFGRVMAEFWADGPKSETPPGHWNVLANLASDGLAPNLRVGGTGPVIDRLQWDVKMYFALNGAVHDAAIAAWGLKGYYDSVRPISMIRYMGGKGQSSDPAQPSYDKEGLPLVPGLVELITKATTAPGQRHAALAGHEGEIAILAWTGRGSSRQTGFPTRPPPSSRRRSPRMRPATAHSAGRPRRCWWASPAASSFPAGRVATPFPPARSSSSKVRRQPSRCSGRPTTMRRTRPAGRACGAGSTSRRMTSRVAGSARSAARPRGLSRSGTTLGPRARDRHPGLVIGGSRP
jgi:hypothetical protein